MDDDHDGQTAVSVKEGIIKLKQSKYARTATVGGNSNTLSVVSRCQSVVVISEKLLSASGQRLHKRLFSRKHCSSQCELTWPQLLSFHHPASSSGCYLQSLWLDQLTSASALCNWYYISTAGWICPKYTVNRRSCRETMPDTTELAVIQYRAAGSIDSALKLLN